MFCVGLLFCFVCGCVWSGFVVFWLLFWFVFGFLFVFVCCFWLCFGWLCFTSVHGVMLVPGDVVVSAWCVFLVHTGVVGLLFFGQRFARGLRGVGLGERLSCLWEFIVVFRLWWRVL